MHQLSPLSLDPGSSVTVQMTVEEYLTIMGRLGRSPKPEKRIGRGLQSIMDLFQCSRAQASIIAKSDWFQPAIFLRKGKHICVDLDIAAEVAKEYSKKKPAM